MPPQKVMQALSLAFSECLAGKQKSAQERIRRIQFENPGQYAMLFDAAIALYQLSGSWEHDPTLDNDPTYSQLAGLVVVACDQLVIHDDKSLTYTNVAFRKQIGSAHVSELIYEKALQHRKVKLQIPKK
ncbi:MAG: hypothetical protein QM758_10640 [Armatimonas sp.]